MRQLMVVPIGLTVDHDHAALFRWEAGVEGSTYELQAAPVDPALVVLRAQALDPNPSQDLGIVTFEQLDRAIQHPDRAFSFSRGSAIPKPLAELRPLDFLEDRVQPAVSSLPELRVKLGLEVDPFVRDPR